MVRVKICGVTTVADAQAASDLGADAIGVVFAKSPRRVSLRTAEKISRAVGPWISVVGVFVDESAENILRAARECGLCAIQLHGRERAADIKRLAGFRVIKAFHVDRNFSPGNLKDYREADAFLFDTKIGDKIGGTGLVFDWKVLKSLSTENRVIISGGLHPQNVAEAVRFFKPYGVDVSSGVEKSPGKKNLRRVREFIRNAKKVEF